MKLSDINIYDEDINLEDTFYAFLDEYIKQVELSIEDRETLYDLANSLDYSEFTCLHDLANELEIHDRSLTYFIIDEANVE